MQPKLILSPAYAARAGMSDVDLASLFDMELLRVIPASENNTCPRCGNHADDSYAQLLTYEPAERAEKVSGRRIVWCLCEAMYSYAIVHAIDVEQLPGQARVRATSELVAKSDAPPPMNRAALGPVDYQWLAIQSAPRVAPLVVVWWGDDEIVPAAAPSGISSGSAPLPYENRRGV